MKKANDILRAVEPHVVDCGFETMGWLRVEDGRSGLLIGNKGSSFWSAFTQSAEYRDGLPDPLNRWTEAQIAPLATELGAEARYPFGNKIWPFQHYAKMAMGIEQSPIGLLIHPECGLWFAFRALLVFDDVGEISIAPRSAHPCDTCGPKPCLSSCPVAAFTSDGYDHEACRSHLHSQAGSECRTRGCLARRACPVGSRYENLPAHQAFHMDAFV